MQERQGVKKNAGNRGTKGFLSLIHKAFASHTSFRHCERKQKRGERRGRRRGNQ
jgi:hypothetical protein